MPRSSSIDHHHLQQHHDGGHHHPALDMSGGPKDEGEKRAKREIANMNERRRMQNINSGFHSLRTLLPHKHDGEKLSKAAILSHTTSYIFDLEREITSLLQQNSELKRHLGGAAGVQLENNNPPEWLKRLGTQPPDCPSCKRRKFENNNNGSHHDIDSSPMGGDGSSTESSSEQELSKSRNSSGRGRQNGGRNEATSLRKQLAKIQKELDEERKLRGLLEEELNYNQNKPSNLPHNGQNRHYHHNASHHLHNLDPVADEVEIATESIEIEMHSCPASPPETISMTNCDQGPLYHLTGGMPHTLDLSAHHKLLDSQTGTGGGRKNAIALPVDMPFVPPREVSPEMDTTTGNAITNAANSKLSPMALTTTNGANQVVFLLEPGNVLFSADGTKLHPSIATTTAGGASQILHFVEASKGGGAAALLTHKQYQQLTTTTTTVSATPTTAISMTISDTEPTMTLANSKATAAQESPESAQKTSRQNLNTIVEAIRHLEGDHLFNDQKMMKAESPLKLKRESDDVEARFTNKSSEQKPDPKTILNSLAEGAMAVSTGPFTPTSATLASIIAAGADAASVSASTQPRPQIIQAITRPNVIVANSVEN